MATTTQAAKAYVQQAVMTASREKLVALLYDHALRHLARARRAVEEKQIASAGEALSRVFSIVSELRSSLDHERGGEVAKDLDRLYEFVQDRLMRANREREIELIDQARKVISELWEGWNGILRAH